MSVNMDNSADDLGQQHLTSGVTTPSTAQNFPPYTLGRVTQTHHMVTNKVEQGTMKVPEKLLSIRLKEKACVQSQ